MSQKIAIRRSIDSDINSITRIYAREVIDGLASFEIEPPAVTEMARRRDQLLKDGYPYLVATMGEKIIGYAYAGSYRSREAYRHTLENSVYVAPESRQLGVGRKLLTNLLNACSNDRWNTVIAVIGDRENKSSIALHESLGFVIVGILKDVGHKHGRWVDSVLMQKHL